MSPSERLKKLRIYLFDRVRESASSLNTMLLLYRCEDTKSMTEEEQKELKAIYDSLIAFSTKIGERTQELK